MIRVNAFSITTSPVSKVDLVPPLSRHSKPILNRRQRFLCFNNTSIYRNCQEQYRLTANGTLNVSGNAVDAFCSGPCLAETQLVLKCIDGILSNFNFYNGATIRAVNATILIACGSGIGRGNFNITGNATPPASPPTISQRVRRPFHQRVTDHSPARPPTISPARGPGLE
ncbi:unnamed protein product [Spirodela intermedia]|uniref:DUF7731 domain-containing protein n=1 Tax=Spirodela intermedia TaxID=51605 RepID=A0ABN7EAH0_SPIIN|nr:unnamed protein product [Spirodela intermedia]